MNINLINNTNFQAKLPKQRINVMGKVNNYIEQSLADNKATIEKFAKKHNVNVNVAQKDSLLLINAGPKTTTYNWNEVENRKNFLSTILANIIENAEIKAGKSFSR